MTDMWWVETKGKKDYTPAEQRFGIREIKKRLSMRRLLLHYGLNVPDTGTSLDWQPVSCPFHKDKRPSASFNASENRFRCHVCDVGGDVVDVVACHEGLTTKEAMQWIRENITL